MLKSWHAITLWKRVFIGLTFGIAIGLGLHYGLGDTGKHIAETWFKPFGDAFVNLIRMLIVPLIVTTLVSGMVAMGDARRLGSLGIKNCWPISAHHIFCSLAWPCCRNTFSTRCRARRTYICG